MAFLSTVAFEPTERLSRLVRQTLTEAIVAAFDRTQGIYAIEGMSGARYRWFINALIHRLENPAYLEIGSWMGSTLCAATHGNAATALAIDDWSQFGGPKDAFLANVARFGSERAAISFLEGDFRRVDYAELARHLRPFGVFLFDGPHAEQDQYDGLIKPLPALAQEFVFICDDWNWQPVRSGTHRAILDAGLTLVYSAEIRTTLDNTHGEPRFGESDWHNGYFIGVLRKPE